MGQTIYKESYEELSNWVNMLIHRDYRDSSGSVVKIYDDRIEFFNPGGLYGGLTKEELLQFNYQPQARNKMLAKAFKLIGKIEKYGSGIKRIFDICENYGIIPPKINISENSFEVILYKEKLDVTENVTEDVTENVTENKLLNILKKSPNITTTELAGLLGVSRRTIARYIEKLKKQNKIKRIGPDKGGHWEVINE